MNMGKDAVITSVKNIQFQVTDDDDDDGGGSDDDVNDNNDVNDNDVNDNDTEYSFEFSSCLSVDLPSPQKMRSAEELFFDGKLRAWQSKDSGSSAESAELCNQGKAYFAIVDSERSELERRNSDVCDESSWMKEADLDFRVHDLPMVRTSLNESLAMAKRRLQYLHESPRCLSMTVEGSRGHPHRSCISLNSSRCSSPTRLRTSGTFSQPPTTPTSPKASSAQKGSKFLHFFKLKKHLSNNKDPVLLPLENPNPSTRTRLSRTFWPFSRSNSAGESKSSQRILSLPRRSNSAGESKTTSSSLLPNKAINRCTGGEVKQRIGDDLPLSHILSIGRKSHTSQSFSQQTDEIRFPPRSTLKKVHYASNGYADSITLSDVVSFPASSSSRSTPTVHAFSDVPHIRQAQRGEGDYLTTVRRADSSCISRESNANFDSLGRHVRHASVTTISASTGSRVSLAPNSGKRASPARQYSGANIENLARGMQRRRPQSRGLTIRPRDALSRDTASVQVMPVLNVPACMTPSSKSKIFNLGNLFSKKEKAAAGYTMLAATDSQNGG
ncbi:hypothetical protein KP509_09G090100 [Ceratopteris richardii]|nr:hypothetical protein KP509_09G090100 [Ceratopteris richardii]